MSFLLRWLDLKRDRRAVGLRPHRDLVLAVAYDRAYDRVLAAVDATLGAHVALDDRPGGTIEAAFGLINSERVRCTLHARDAGTTEIRIEAFFAAGTSRPRSEAVDALADELARG
ncbi:MAG TPA: hypothetical protein VJP76_00950 [Candidatus Tumulicola sp.]|nr:hypothetical protein [Candidatus Tumulicola sp.]